MDDTYQSCLVSRLSRLVDLTDDERSFLAQMEENEQPRQKGQSIVQVGDAVQGMMVSSARFPEADWRHFLNDPIIAH